MNPLLRALLSLCVIASFFFPTLRVNSESASPPDLADSAAVTNGIVLVAGSTIDLMWDPAGYYGTEPFVCYEIHRSKSDNTHYAMIRSTLYL